MLHVYHFILDHRVGGPHVYVDCIRQAMNGKVESTILTTGHGPMTDISLFNLRHYVNFLYLIEVPLNIILIIWLNVTGKIKVGRTIYNIHGSANIAPIVAARMLSIPIVWHFHETLNGFRKLVHIGRWILKRHPHQIVTAAKKAINVFNIDNGMVIPAPVDSGYWSRKLVNHDELTTCDWAFKKNGEMPFQILAVGNLNPLKGMDILLQAMEDIEGPWHVKIVGAELKTHRDYARDLYHRACELEKPGKGRKIEFMGWQEKARVRALLASCDLFVLPSRSEACPIALLEAMAMECICVVADVGDVREMIPKDMDRFVFDAGDIPKLKQLIEYVKCLSIIERNTIGSLFRKKVADVYSPKNITKRTMDCYWSLLTSENADS